MRFPWKSPWPRAAARSDRRLISLAEGRVGAESIDAVAAALGAAGFSPAAYRESNADLLRALKDENQALWHFIAYSGCFAHGYPIALRPDGLARLCELKTPPRFTAEVIANMLGNVCRPHAAFWRLPVEERKAWFGDLLDGVAALGSVYLIVGDSHSNLYRHLVAPAGHDGRFPLPLHVLCTGSSAKGLANQQSRSGAGARLAALAGSLPDRDIDLFFKFGQVDVEFSFTFDRIRSGRTTFRETELVRFCEESTDAYVGFLADHFAARSATVMSIFPPTLSDAAWRDGYTNAQVVAVETEQALDEVVRGVRELEIPSQLERTRHHAIFNEMLARKSAAAGFRFVDDFSSFLGATGTVQPRYVSSHGGRDHHMDPAPTADVLSRLVYAHLAARGRLGPDKLGRA